MKNKGIKIGVVFILLFALLSVAGCQQEDVVIVGAESGQPGPTSGQLRIGFTLLVSKGASTQPSRDITINNLSLSADTSFTVYEYRYRRYNRTDRCGDRHRSDIHICKF